MIFDWAHVVLSDTCMDETMVAFANVRRLRSARNSLTTDSMTRAEFQPDAFLGRWFFFRVILDF